MNYAERIERRLKLQNLNAYMTVIKAGIMGKAAQQLNTSQSAVSRSIAELEHALGVRLLDRSRRGVEPTGYGRALLECGIAVFDELRQGVRKIESLADPTKGEIRIGGNEPPMLGMIPAVIRRLQRSHPFLTIHVSPIDDLAQQQRELHERKLDLVFARIPQSVNKDIATEVLFHDRTVIVAGSQSKWAHRRKIEFAQLVDEPWCLPPFGSLPGSIFAELFRAAGVESPRRAVTSGSLHLHTSLLAEGPFLMILPMSLLKLGVNLPPFRILPVDLPIPAWPIGLMILKGRTRTPALDLFIECVRDVIKPLAQRK
jgi:DNA-binding transcriptional LysR family regulator